MYTMRIATSLGLAAASALAAADEKREQERQGNDRLHGVFNEKGSEQRVSPRILPPSR